MTVPYFKVEVPNSKFYNQTGNLDLALHFFTPYKEKNIHSWPIIEHLDIIEESRELIRQGEIVTWEELVMSP